jgi:hypothetical protein
MSKTLDVVNNEDAKSKISDIKIVGRDLWVLLCKASSESQKWMKSTKAMEIVGVGCVVQVTTQQGDNISESVTFVPGVKIGTDESNNRFLTKV